VNPHAGRDAMSSTERCLAGQQEANTKRPDAARERDAGTCHNAPGKGASWRIGKHMRRSKWAREQVNISSNRLALLPPNALFRANAVPDDAGFGAEE
jgi:hypothetical protein